MVVFASVLIMEGDFVENLKSGIPSRQSHGRNNFSDFSYLRGFPHHGLWARLLQSLLITSRSAATPYSAYHDLQALLISRSGMEIVRPKH